MRLSELIDAADCALPGTVPEADVRGIAYDSRQVGAGFLFAALPGTRYDGVDYIADAVERGASAVITEAESVKVSIPCLAVKDCRAVMAQAAKTFYGDPGAKLRMVGITGTNGKTTVSFLVRNALREAGMNPGLIGTVQYEIGRRVIPAARTTPESVDLQRMLNEMIQTGCRSAAVEVSSHSLVQKRIDGVEFDVACFTNLSPEHLDYHADMDDYFNAKARLFELQQRYSKKPTSVINGDDEWGRKLLDDVITNGDTITYGLGDSLDVRALAVQTEGGMTRFRIETPWGSADLAVRLMGMFNVYNVLAATACACAVGVDFETACAAAEACESVPGRLEEVPAGRGVRSFVDYAHTDDALRNVLVTLRELNPARLIVVFGCGGNRDIQKRSRMGAVACELADLSVVTSDNPRRENPADIIAQVLKGYGDDSQYEVEPDREKAIGRALTIAQKGDVILVAGKGHEAFQEFESTKVPFDDREVIRRLAGTS